MEVFRWIDHYLLTALVIVAGVGSVLAWVCSSTNRRQAEEAARRAVRHSQRASGTVSVRIPNLSSAAFAPFLARQAESISPADGAAAVDIQAAWVALVRAAVMDRCGVEVCLPLSADRPVRFAIESGHPSQAVMDAAMWVARSWVREILGYSVTVTEMVHADTPAPGYLVLRAPATTRAQR